MQPSQLGSQFVEYINHTDTWFVKASNRQKQEDTTRGHSRHHMTSQSRISM